MPFQPAQCPGQEILCYTVNGFLFEKLIFVCNGCKVFFLTGSCLRINKSVMSETKVYSSVCRCVAPPFSPEAPHIQSHSWGVTSWIKKITFVLSGEPLEHSVTADVRSEPPWHACLWAALLRVQVPCGWQPLSCFCGPSRRAACPETEVAAGRSFWEVLWHVGACVRVSFLNRHSNFSCVYRTDLFTNKIQWYILETILNMFFLHT